MAQIRDSLSKQSYPLRAHHTFGRCTERSDTVIESPIASRIHLALEWDGQRWNARDLSKNGTWRGDCRLTPNESTPLARGDQLHLGSPDMPALELIDDSAPVSSLLGLDGTPNLALEPFTFLPDQDHPEAVITYAYQHRSWTVQTIEHDTPQHANLLHHGDKINYGGHSWEVFLTETEQSTEINLPPDTSVEDIEFIFELSQDEENTALTLHKGGEDFSLGERSHHYLLLHLARLRATQAASGFDTKTQGWVDNAQIRKDLGLDMPHINIMIFRARKQIAETLANSWDSEHLVERGKGRMRFGGTHFRIYKGAQLAFTLSA